MSGEPIVARIGHGVASLRGRGLGSLRRRRRSLPQPRLPVGARGIRAAPTAATGWQPLPIAIDGADGRPAAVMPAYLKSHSQGEYVFDHGWADAYERAGGAYYPKLQIAVPFTPVPGRRLLARDPALAPGPDRRGRAARRRATASPPPTPPSSRRSEVPLFERAGWLIRADSQFHWLNQGYAGLRRLPRRLVVAQAQGDPQGAGGGAGGAGDRRISPAPRSTEAHWDAFWAFYQDTGARKWGRPYLTRAFFSLLGERHGGPGAADLRAARRRPIAGALNLIGADALYGRYWGAIEEVPHPPFRALLLPGDRGGDRARPRAGSRRARRGRTSWRAAIGRCRPGRPIISPIPASAARSRIISPPSAARWRARSRRSTK